MIASAETPSNAEHEIEIRHCESLAEGRPLAELPRERMEELWNLSKLQQPLEAAHAK